MTTDSSLPSCDLLIEAGWVIPVEPHGLVLADHAVAVRDGAIVALLPTAQARAAFDARDIVSRPQSVLIPGLVNAHTHNAMTSLRGVADDLPLMAWLTGHIWPIEGAVMGPAFVAHGVELAIAEMVRGGTTCCNDMYFFPDVAAATYRRHGFRASVGLIVIDFPTAWAASTDEYFDKAGEVHDLYRSDPLLRTCFAPHAPYTVGDASFERIAMLAEQLDLAVHCHVHETAAEVADAVRAGGQRPIARLDRLGVFNDRLIAVHMTQLSDAEIALCAARGVTVAHCPESNLKLASGICRSEHLRRAGVNLALGTDGCASNNDLDLFGEMRTAALIAKVAADDAAAMRAADVLRMATLGGARGLGMGDRIGSLEPGKRADLVLVDMDRIETQPLYDPLSQLVYACGRQQVTDVWIDGRRLLREGALVDMDTDALLAHARQWRDRIVAIGRAP